MPWISVVAPIRRSTSASVWIQSEPLGGHWLTLPSTVPSLHQMQSPPLDARGQLSGARCCPTNTAAPDSNFRDIRQLRPPARRKAGQCRRETNTAANKHDVESRHCRCGGGAVEQLGARANIDVSWRARARACVCVCVCVCTHVCVCVRGSVRRGWVGMCGGVAGCKRTCSSGGSSSAGPG